MKDDAGLTTNIECKSCRNILVDAVTLTRCNDSFCRLCFLRHLQTENTCPSCGDVLEDLQTAFRRDTTLQRFAYKLSNQHFWKQHRKKTEFIEKRFPTPEELKLIESMELNQFAKFICREDEQISLQLEYISSSALMEASVSGTAPSTSRSGSAAFLRYFRCSCLVKMRHFRSLLQRKFDLPDNYVLHFVDPAQCDSTIDDSYTIQDMIYIFGWSRTEPFRIYFTLNQVVCDEDKPPVLQVEEGLDHMEEPLTSFTMTPLEPEPLEQMPALTVNLSSDLFQSDSNVNFGSNGTRMPIITEATMAPAKKKRRTMPRPKKERTALSKPVLAKTLNSGPNDGPPSLLTMAPDDQACVPLPRPLLMRTSSESLPPALGPKNFSPPTPFVRSPGVRVSSTSNSPKAHDMPVLVQNVNNSPSLPSSTARLTKSPPDLRRMPPMLGAPFFEKAVTPAIASAPLQACASLPTTPVSGDTADNRFRLTAIPVPGVSITGFNVDEICLAMAQHKNRGVAVSASGMGSRLKIAPAPSKNHVSGDHVFPSGADKKSLMTANLDFLAALSSQRV